MLDYCFPCLLWKVRIGLDCQDLQYIGKVVWALPFFLITLVELYFMSMIVAHRGKTLQEFPGTTSLYFMSSPEIFRASRASNAQSSRKFIMANAISSSLIFPRVAKASKRISHRLKSLPGLKHSGLPPVAMALSAILLANLPSSTPLPPDIALYP